MTQGDLYAEGVKIQRDRQQKQQDPLSDQDLAEALSVRPERWAAAVQGHQTSQVFDIDASPEQPTRSSEDDEQLNWLKDVLHQLEGMPGQVLQAHLIGGETIIDMAQAFNCSRSTLRLHLQEGLNLLRHWAERDGLMPSQTS